MNYRTIPLRHLGRTGFEISEISLGTWQVGGKWGEKFNHSNADQILNEAIDQGINFIDTADVYGGGESKKAVEALKQSFPHVALSALALKWILLFKEVSCVIPGASNVEAGKLPPLTPKELAFIDAIYENRIKKQVHHLW